MKRNNVIIYIVFSVFTLGILILSIFTFIRVTDLKREHDRNKYTLLREMLKESRKDPVKHDEKPIDNSNDSLDDSSKENSNDPPKEPKDPLVDESDDSKVVDKSENQDLNQDESQSNQEGSETSTFDPYDYGSIPDYEIVNNGTTYDGITYRINEHVIAHIVQPSDTLSDLSRRFECPIETIAIMNNISDINMIYDGSFLYIKNSTY